MPCCAGTVHIGNPENKKEKNMKVRVFHSMPLRGLTDEQIDENRKRDHVELIPLVAKFKDVPESEVEILDTYISKQPEIGDYQQAPLVYFGMGVKDNLSRTDVLVMGHGWTKARGCIAEACVALAYDIPIVNLETKLVAPSNALNSVDVLLKHLSVETQSNGVHQCSSICGCIGTLGTDGA